MPRLAVLWTLLQTSKYGRFPQVSRVKDMKTLAAQFSWNTELGLQASIRFLELSALIIPVSGK